MSDLTKWPRLVVVGEPVTREQANDILIRTNNWTHLYSNDRDWEGFVERVGAKVLGRPIEPSLKHGNEDEFKARLAAYHKYWDDLAAWKERAGVLELHYLRNARIMSSWIGGPHGWCDWDGRIGCSNYNIGKWPTVEEVTEDLTAIAAAFPYLDMQVQLVTDEGEGHIAETWTVRSGAVSEVDSSEPIARPLEYTDDVIAAQVEGMFRLGRERGVTPQRLHEALSQVAAQISSAASAGGR